jgi:hypothetical protein
MEVFYEDLARRMRFSHRRSVPRLLHGLLGAHRPVSTCLSVFNLSVCHLSVYHLSVYHFSVDLIGWPIRLPALPFPHLITPTFLDSLDSELWYRFGCRAAALASSSTLAVGQSFRQLFTTRSALQG